MLRNMVGMPGSSRSSAKWILPLVVLPLFTTACEDEQIVYRNRLLFDDPLPAADSMLGYGFAESADAKLTVCGNCHVSTQAEWVLTAHADAWASLQNSGHPAAACEGCHTVNEMGNRIEEPAGWLAVQDPRYHDVQCESCHGPGLGHVNDPESFQPLASIQADTGLTNGCGECHSGAHHPFVDEWVQSAHAVPNEHAAENPSCQGCHTAEGALVQFGEHSDYVEKNDAEHLGIVCAVCHDPHGGANDPAEQIEGQLRFTVHTQDTELHLCARCHDRRSAPSGSSTQGLEPHSPETALIAGEAGWWPAGMRQDTLMGTHSSAPELCATCHVNTFEVTDQQTGEFVMSATGHLFNAIPCVDAQGVPNTDDCVISVDARNWDGCTTSGCHGSENAAFSALVTGAEEIEALADSLYTLLQTVDPGLEDPDLPIDPADGVLTAAEGALFNWHLATFGGGDGRVDPLAQYAGSLVHNPFLMKRLLRASIEAVLDEAELVGPEGSAVPVNL